jgi:hypothetical protein
MLFRSRLAVNSVGSFVSETQEPGLRDQPAHLRIKRAVQNPER